MSEKINEMFEEERKPEQKLKRIVRLLWKRFLHQSILTKWITLLVLLFTIIVSIVFFSTYIIWRIFSFVVFKGFVNTLDWYLRVTDDNAVNQI